MKKKKTVPNADTSNTAPMETMTKNRVYVIVTKNKKSVLRPKYITYYDEENKRKKQIDFYSSSEKLMVDNVKKF